MLSGLEEALPDWRAAQQQAQAMPGVIAAAPYIEARAMLAAGERLTGTELRGIDPVQERGINGLAGVMTSGKLDDLAAGAWRIILGKALAEELGVKVGDTVVVIAGQGHRHAHRHRAAHAQLHRQRRVRFRHV